METQDFDTHPRLFPHSVVDLLVVMNAKIARMCLIDHILSRKMNMVLQSYEFSLIRTYHFGNNGIFTEDLPRATRNSYARSFDILRANILKSNPRAQHDRTRTRRRAYTAPSSPAVLSRFAGPNALRAYQSLHYSKDARTSQISYARIIV